MAYNYDYKGKTVSYEEVLKWTGEIGIYQAATFLYVACLAFVTSETIYMNFLGYRMEHWCLVPELQELPFHLQKHLAIPYTSSSNESYENCLMFNVNYTEIIQGDYDSWERPVNAETEECHSWVFDQSVYPENIINQWELVCGKNWQVEFVSTVTLLGFLFGSLMGGALSDRFGRVKSLAVGIVIKAFSCLASTLAPNYIVLVVARFFVGVAAQHCYVVGFVIAVENVGAGHRAWTGIAYNMFYSFGYALVPLYAYACRDWRHLQIVMTAPQFIFLLTVWFLPESPRWLISKAKWNKAEEGIRKIAAVNKGKLPHDFCISCIEIDETANPEGSKATFLDLFKTPTIRRYTLILFVIWFSVNLNYFALSLNAGSLAGDVFLNTSLLGLVEIPANIICFTLMGLKVTGRRITLGAINILGGVACLICVPIILIYEESVAVTALSIIGKGAVASAWAGIYVFTSELFPTEVRNNAIGTCSMVARVSGIAAPYVGGLLGDVWSPMPSLIFGIVGTGSGMLTLVLPETLGRKLPETIAELESRSRDKNKDAVKQAVNMEKKSSENMAHDDSGFLDEQKNIVQKF